MHILIISNGYPTNYVPLNGIFHRDQAEALVLAKCTVGVISINPIAAKTIINSKKVSLGLVQYTEKEVNTSIYKYINMPKRPTYCVKKAVKNGKKIADDYIKKNGVPDIIHLHNYESILLVMYIKEKYKIPFVITEHSSRFMNELIPSSMEKYAKLAFSNSSYNISVSNEFANVLSQKYNEDFHYIPNVVNTDFFKPEPAVPEKDTFIFIGAGALDDNKNQRLLLHSFKEVLSSGRKSKLKIAGDGPNFKELKALSKKLAIQNNVTFLGKVSREKLNESLNESSVFVHPSIKETFGVVLIEAMSCGLPIISTKSGGPESIITSNKLGILCDHDIQSLTLGMLEVYDNFANYDSSVIRREVIDKYSPTAVTKQLLSVYNKVLSEKMEKS